MTTTTRTWFDDDREDGTALAELADDLVIRLRGKDTMTIAGPAGVELTIDIDDAADLTEALNEAVRILQERGYRLEPRTRE